MKQLIVAGLVSAAVFFGGAVVLLRGQDAGPGPILRSETRIVLLDAVAMDKNGKFAAGLTKKDFRIWEDGKEQKISGFSLESSGVSPERANKHYIAMFFDTSASQTSQLVVRHEDVRFIDGFASPDRMMAVINYSSNSGAHIAQNFTNDKEQLKKAFALVAGSSGSAPTDAGGAFRGRGAGAAMVDPSGSRNMLVALRGVVNSLANIRGRKALVFFTGGMTVTSEAFPELQATIDACNKANVALYTVGAGAGSAESGDSAVTNHPVPNRRASEMNFEQLNQGQNLSRSLAEGTGGLDFLTSNDVAASLGAIAQEQDEYYLIGYAPTVYSAEGSCHELKVKVDRGDLEVRARKSYCTSKPVDLLSGKPAGKELEERAASSASGNATAKMQLPWFYTAPNAARVDLALDIAPSALKFQKEKGKLHGEFDLAGVAYKADGTVATRVSDTVKLDFNTQQEADAFLKAPFHYENQFDIAPGQYTFRMAFSSGSSDAQGFGRVEMPLKVEPWNGQALSVSAVALSHGAHPAADLASGLDVSLLEGIRPLIARGTEVVPTGTARFQRNEQGFFYMEIYEPLLTAAKPDAPLPPVRIRVRFLNRATGEVKSDTGAQPAAIFERAGNPIVPILSHLPIASLPAGGYKMEVSVMRETGDPVVRTADFDVN